MKKKYSIILCWTVLFYSCYMQNPPSRRISEFKLKKKEPKCDALLKSGTGTSDEYLDCGYAKELVDKPDEALKFYNKAIEIDSSNGKSYWNRGAFKLRHKDKKGGCEDFEQATKHGINRQYLEYCK